MFDTFIKNGKSQLKDEEEMCPDSAIWYIEGTANYTYGSASEEVSFTIVDSTFITLPVENELISSTEVWNAYTVMIDTIRARFLELNGAESQLLSVEVKRQLLSETEMECKVTFIFGAGALPPDYCSFNQVDYWKWWNQSTNNGGICSGPNNGNNPELDAAILIQQKIMNCKGVPAGNYYWEPIDNVDIYPWDYPNPNWNSGPNYYQYRLYWNYEDAPDFHDCLSPTECNFYLSGTKWVINTAKSLGGARPDDQSFILVEMTGDLLLIPGSSYSYYIHWGIVHYGILHWSLHPPTPLN